MSMTSLFSYSDLQVKINFKLFFCDTALNLQYEIARTGSTAKSRGEPQLVSCYCAVSAVPAGDNEEDLVKQMSTRNNKEPAQELSTL